MRAFGKDRARETQAPARSILAAVPTPLGPPVGCHPTPSDGIAHANHRTVISVGKGLILYNYGFIFANFRNPTLHARTGTRHGYQIADSKFQNQHVPVPGPLSVSQWEELTHE